jgi:hypothetical protein
MILESMRREKQQATKKKEKKKKKTRLFCLVSLPKTEKKKNDDHDDDEEEEEEGEEEQRTKTEKKRRKKNKRKKNKNKNCVKFVCNLYANLDKGCVALWPLPFYIQKYLKKAKEEELWKTQIFISPCKNIIFKTPQKKQKKKSIHYMKPKSFNIS